MPFHMLALALVLALALTGREHDSSHNALHGHVLIPVAFADAPSTTRDQQSTRRASPRLKIRC